MFSTAMAHLIAGYLLDIFLGDPRWMPHPVRLLGRVIARAEGLLRRVFPPSPGGERLAGVILTVSVVGFAYFSVAFLLFCAGRIHPWLFHGLSVWFAYTVLATRSLDQETRVVYRELVRGDLQRARKLVANVVGRDTAELDENEVARAAVETIAENTVDAVVSPIFFLALGGPALGIAYKAVSTLDSMVGYKNERYLYLGWASARLDDLANFIPARLTGWLLVPLSALVSGQDFLLSVKTVKRDRAKHESPNSAHPESAFAGALRVQLGGPCRYQGRLVEHPVIGSGLGAVQPKHIPKAILLMYITSLLALSFGLGLIGIREGW